MLLYKVCWIANCLLLLYMLCSMILIFTGDEFVRYFFFFSVYSHFILYFFTIPALLLLIKNHIICYKKDVAKQGLMLFFFNVFYSPFYSLRAYKNGWI